MHNLPNWIKANPLKSGTLLLLLAIAAGAVFHLRPQLTSEARLLQEILSNEHFSRGMREYNTGHEDLGLRHLQQAWKFAIPETHIARALPVVLADSIFRGGQLLAIPMRHPRAHFVSFSPDGTRIATGGFGNAAQLWDAYTGQPIGEPMQHEDGVLHGIFSPDGNRLLTVSSGNPGGPVLRLSATSNGALLKKQSLNDDYRVLYSLTFSHDGRMLLTGGSDGAARVFHSETLEPAGEPLWHGEPVADPLRSLGEDTVLAVFFTPDDQRIVTVSYKSVQTWNSQTRSRIAERKVGEDSIYAAALAPAGDRVAIGTHFGTVSQSDVLTGIPLGEVQQHAGVHNVAFSADGTRLISGGNLLARLWDVQSGKPVGDPLRHESWVTCAFTPDGTRAITRSESDKWWDARTGEPIAERPRRCDAAGNMAFSADGTKLATLCKDGRIYLWTMCNRVTVGEPMLHGGEVTQAKFSPDGTRLATGTGKHFGRAPYRNVSHGMVRFWEGSTAKPVSKETQIAGGIDSLEFSPQGQLVASGSMNGTSLLWDAQTGAFTGISMPAGNVSSVAFSPDGTRLGTGDSIGKSRIWDARTGTALTDPLGEQLCSLSVDSVCRTKVRFSADGRRLVSAAGNLVQLWDAVSGAPLCRPIVQKSGVWCVCFSPDGTRLATGSHGMAQLWDGYTGAPIGKPLQHLDAVTHVAFSPDGQRLATACYNHVAHLWDLPTHSPLGEPMQHSSTITHLSFSTDGARLLTASFDRTARIWDAHTATPLGDVISSKSPIGTAEFNPAGTLLVTGGADNMARLWDVEPIRIPEKLLPVVLELATGQTVNNRGEATPLTEDERQQREQTYAKSGKEFQEQTRQRQLRRQHAWHIQKAHEYESSAQWFAARFHAQHVLSKEPDHEKSKQILAKATTNLSTETNDPTE